jgi:hypothetical protein
MSRKNSPCPHFPQRKKHGKHRQRIAKEKLPKNWSIFPGGFVVCIESQQKRLTLAADCGMVFTAK